MPKYILPQVDGRDDLDGIPPIDPAGTVRDEYRYPDEWARRVSIPINDAILAALTVGQTARVNLRCRVEELASNQSATGAGRTELTVVIDEVDAYPEDQLAAEEDFLTGFGRMRGGRPRRY
jgi:hypothetical protein